MHRAAVFALVLAACSNAVLPSDAGVDSPADIELDSTTIRTFVFRKMFAGDSDRAFKANMTAWRTYGDDIDGTPNASCKSASQQADGDNGIDNSFGANVLPLLMMNGFAIPSLQWSESIQQGAARPILVRVAGDSVDVHVGALLPNAPDFSGNGTWALSSLVSADMGNVQLSAGQISAKAASASVVLYVPYSNKVLALRIHDFAFHASDSMQNGSISGILDPNELVEAVRQASATCTTFDAQIRQAQDIMLDGTQNPGADCTGISIGIGFEGAVIGFGDMMNDPGPQKGCP